MKKLITAIAAFLTSTIITHTNVIKGANTNFEIKKTMLNQDITLKIGNVNQEIMR